MPATYQDAFLEAIRDDPDDDTHRLVFADWLEEQGDAASLARAELIRAQIELEEERLPAERRAFLDARVRELLAGHGRLWARDYLGRVRSHEFRRGFVDRIELSATEFLHHAPALLRAGPVRQVALEVNRRHAGRLARCEELARVPGLEVRWQGEHPEDLLPVLDGPFLAGLRELRLRCPNPARTLARASPLEHLEALDIGGRGGDPDALTDLLARGLPALRRLYLGSSGLRSETLADLARMPVFRQLTHLDLGHNGIDASGALALARAPLAGPLRCLWLGCNGIGDVGAAALAKAPALAGLTRLFLASNRIGADGVRALARSPHLAGLAVLDLDYNHLTASALQTLARSRPLANLRTLFLRGSRPPTEKTRTVLTHRFGPLACLF